MFEIPACKYINLIQGRKCNVSAIFKACLSDNLLFNVSICQFNCFFGQANSLKILG